MFDTATARRMMVDGQVRTADVTNLDLIAAMLAVPRELSCRRRSPIRLISIAISRSATAARCSNRWFSPSSFRERRSAPATVFSMSAVRPAIPRRCCRRSRVRLWRWRKMRLWRNGHRTRWRPSTPRTSGRNRPADRRLAAGRALRPHFPQWRHRNRARQLGPPVETRWPARLYLRPGPDRQSDDLPDGRGPPCRPPDFRCRSAGFAGFCCGSGVRFLAPSAVGPLTFSEGPPLFAAIQAFYPLWPRCAYSQIFAFHPQLRGFAFLARRLRFACFASSAMTLGGGALNASAPRVHRKGAGG